MSQVPAPILESIARGRFDEPFAVLGPHPGVGTGGGRVVRAFLPGAIEAAIVLGERRVVLEWLHADGVFEGPLDEAAPEDPDPGGPPLAYRLWMRHEDGSEQTFEDPYRFPPVLAPGDLDAFRAGTDFRAFEKLGARPMEREGVAGVHFALWAPHATRVSVMGDFNRWNGRRHGMRRVGDTGVWEIFLPGVRAGAHYKYELRTPDGGRKSVKADPFAFASEDARGTASVVWDNRGFRWSDDDWMLRRAQTHAFDRPLSIYEVHPGSWRRRPAEAGAAGGRIEDEATRSSGRWLTWPEMADELVPYARDHGFTHLELMPVMEHPFDGSWGYQCTGYFAPTSRFGTPDDFRRFMDAAHRAGLGVILDWVPAHFPRDAHGLGYFDGTHLYEPADPRQGLHPDWNTFEFDYERPEVRSFLLSNAAFWAESFHADGLRVDAVASMLYLDYSRKPGEWVPNEKGGRENLHAVRFLRELNTGLHGLFPGVLTFAEESTSWPGVTRPASEGGLGFDLKWNLGWMNDWLAFFRTEPDRRGPWLEKVTFGLTYAFAERFLLPLSHDEVVHGKRSLLGKMPGGENERLANLRLLYGCLFAHPGRKLLFMGSELAARGEWNHDAQLPWDRLEDDRVRRLANWLRELQRIYREEPALHAAEDSWEGFEWIDPDDRERAMISFLRRAGERVVVVIANFSDERHEAVRFGVPDAPAWVPVLSSEATLFGGGGDLPPPSVPTDATPFHGKEHSIVLDIPALSVTWLEPDLPVDAPGTQGVA